MSYAYQLGPISQSDFDLLHWLAARGYDGSALEECSAIDANDTSAIVLYFNECDAWEVNEYVNDDPDAFLSCCGSEELKDAFVSFLEKIV